MLSRWNIQLAAFFIILVNISYSKSNPLSSNINDDGISNNNDNEVSNNHDENIFKLVILHTNDMHARFAEISRMTSACSPSEISKSQCYGGFARVAHVIRDVRQNASSSNGDLNALVLNAGDTFAGTPYFTIFKTNITTEFVNYLDFDAMSLGNHEFDLSVNGLLKFVNGVKSPTVCANIDARKEPELQKSKLQRSVVIEKNGRSIGIIGYLTTETPKLSYTEKLTFLDEVESINAESERLVNAGVNIIIALGHSGFETDKRIAAQCPEVDIVIGGHTNTFLYSGEAPDIEQPQGSYPTMIEQVSGKIVPVVQAYAYTKYIGQLFANFDQYGDLIEAYGNPILLEPDVVQDADILDALKKYDVEIETLKEEKVGETSVFLNHNDCRHSECNLGNLITDGMVHNHANNYHGEFWTDAPIALLTGGDIRASIGRPFQRWNISLSDILTTLPFDNVLKSMTLTGTELLQVLKHSIQRIPEKNGQFIQVSGLHIIYDLTNGLYNPNITVRVRCANCTEPEYFDLIPTANYKVIVNTYLASGGDGYTMFQSKRKTNEGIIDSNCLTRYIQKVSPIIVGKEERIRIINWNKDFISLGKGKNSGDHRTLCYLTIVSMFLVVIYTYKSY